VKLINKFYFSIVMIMAWSLLSCAFAATPVVESFKLDFNTKYQVGARYHCSFTAELFKFTRVQRSTDSSTRHRSLKVKLIGNMTIIALDAHQMIAECEFTVDKFSGWLDQRAIKSDLKGKVLTVLFKQKSAQFIIKSDKYQPLSKQERLLLSLIFPSILEENLAEILGPNRQVAIGVVWKPPGSKFFTLFKKHGIKFSSSKVKLRAELSGRDVLQGRDCFVIEERIKTLNIPSFKFNFTLKVWLPASMEFGNALKFQRQAVWNASATLPSNTPLVIGHSISTTVVNSLDFTMIPQ